MTPVSVLNWTLLDPSDTTSIALTDAIKEHQSSADRIYGNIK